MLSACIAVMSFRILNRFPLSREHATAVLQVPSHSTTCIRAAATRNTESKIAK